MVLLRIVYCIYAFLLFLILLLIVFPFVLLALLLGQPKSGNLVIWLVRKWAKIWLFLIGIRSQNITQEPFTPNTSYILVANHSSYLDIPLIFTVFPFNQLRVLGKKEMESIPIFGTIYKTAVIRVDRSSAEARARSILQLKKMLSLHLSICIFPEGTFNMTNAPLKDFYDGAFKIALETGTPIKPMVFLDAKNLMPPSSIWHLKPGTNRTVILPAIPTEHLAIEHLAQLKQQVYAIMEKTIESY